MDTRNPKESNKILTTFDEQDGIHNTNIEKLVPMIPPACMLEEIPITKKAEQTVRDCRNDISNILTIPEFEIYNLSDNKFADYMSKNIFKIS